MMQIKRQIAKNIFFRYNNFESYYQLTSTFDSKSYVQTSTYLFPLFISLCILIRNLTRLYSINQVLLIERFSTVSALYQFFKSNGSFSSIYAEHPLPVYFSSVVILS